MNDKLAHKNGTINKNAPEEFFGQDRFLVREKIVNKLKEIKLRPVTEVHDYTFEIS